MERREGGEERQNKQRLARKSSQGECGVFLGDARFWVGNWGDAGGGRWRGKWVLNGSPPPGSVLRKGWTGGKPAASRQSPSLGPFPWARGWEDPKQG